MFLILVQNLTAVSKLFSEALNITINGNKSFIVRFKITVTVNLGLSCHKLTVTVSCALHKTPK